MDAAMEAILSDDEWFARLIDHELDQCVQDILVEKMKKFNADALARRQKELERRADEEESAAKGVPRYNYPEAARRIVQPQGASGPTPRHAPCAAAGTSSYPR